MGPRSIKQKESAWEIFLGDNNQKFPKMGSQIATQVQEDQRIPHRIDPSKNTPRHILIKLTKIKHKEKIWKPAREKQWVTYEGTLIRLTADDSAEIAVQEEEAGYIKSNGSEKPAIKINLPSNNLIQNWWRNQKFYRQAKVKRLQHHQTSFTTNAEGTSQAGNKTREKPTYRK